MEHVERHRLVAGLIGIVERHDRVAPDLSFRDLVIGLDHDGDLDQARRRKAHITVDRDRLAGAEIPGDDSESAREVANDRFDAPRDRFGAGTGGGQEKEQREKVHECHRSAW